jgi:hypothetical protein
VLYLFEYFKHVGGEYSVSVHERQGEHIDKEDEKERIVHGAASNDTSEWGMARGR